MAVDNRTNYSRRRAGALYLCIGAARHPRGSCNDDVDGFFNARTTLLNTIGVHGFGGLSHRRGAPAGCRRRANDDRTALRFTYLSRTQDSLEMRWECCAIREGAGRFASVRT
jgi:hypothetical protein